MTEGRVRTWIRRLVVAAVVLVAIVAVWALVSVRIDRPQTYDAIEEHFKYGSIGSEPGVSLLTPIGGILPPVLGVHGPAVRLQ